MRIEVLGTGCPKCKAAVANAQKAVAESGVQAEIVKIENLMDIAARGVMMTPALVIDGDVKVVGKVPTVDEIKKWLV
ncbi:MAG: thioredoxin family protein [Candidatus Bipolaricaulis sp.]|nr:thioredoxin family protein [Candidatus Bipolaricaulis sp.]MDD5646280.1 thioredoxin family protein [Candidatus Bipolaricaulis sp.]